MIILTCKQIIPVIFLQFLLGVFYYIEAAVLFEDIEANVYHDTVVGRLQGVKYYGPANVTSAYHNAA